MNPNIEKLISQLKHSPLVSPKFCSNCGHMHRKEDFHYMQQSDGSAVLNIACSNCAVLHILKVQPGVPGVAMQRLETLVSDVSPNELQKFAGKPKVNKDEAIDAFDDMSGINTLDQFLALFDN